MLRLKNSPLHLKAINIIIRKTNASPPEKPFFFSTPCPVILNTPNVFAEERSYSPEAYLLKTYPKFYLLF